MNFYKKNFKNKSNDGTEFSFPSLLKRCLLFLLVFVSLCVLISLVMSLIFFKSVNPGKMVNIISLTALFSSAFISAFLLSKFNGQKYLLGGIMLGVMIFILLFIGALFTERKIFSADFALRLSVPAVTMIGALIGIKREKKAKRPKHRY